MKRFAWLLLFLSGSVSAQVQVEKPWARAMPPGAEVAGGYLSIRNAGPAADKLVAARELLDHHGGRAHHRGEHGERVVRHLVDRHDLEPLLRQPDAIAPLAISPFRRFGSVLEQTAKASQPCVFHANTRN